MKKFIFYTDLHYGYERRSGHKVPLHDPKAMDLALRFAEDFEPDVVILGGDILDCGPISHHNRHKPGRTEGLRLLADAAECNEKFLLPLHKLPAKGVYIIGNHEDWLTDLEQELPGVNGLLAVEKLMPTLQQDWDIVQQGGHFNLGKLTFCHGDTISGGEHVAKAAVINYERSIRFGHHHTYQVYTKNTPADNILGKTGVAVPCLCTKAPMYGEGRPNRWVQGINYGWVFPDGTYADQVSLITNGRMVANGITYKA